MPIYRFKNYTILDYYEDYYKKTYNNNPSIKDCAKIEVDFMIAELDGDFNKLVYQAWKNGNKSASSAGEIFCKKYERPKDAIGQPIERGENATKIYKIMIK